MTEGGPEERFCPDNLSYAGCEAIHEIGHTFGRQHPGSIGSQGGVCRSQQKKDPDFPFSNGQLSPPNDYIALDNSDSTNFAGMTLLLGPQAHDMMAYCTNPWPSAYTLRAIIRGLECEEDLEAAEQTGTIKSDDCLYTSQEFKHYALGPEFRTLPMLAGTSNFPGLTGVTLGDATSGPPAGDHSSSAISSSESANANDSKTAQQPVALEAVQQEEPTTNKPAVAGAFAKEMTPQH